MSVMYLGTHRASPGEVRVRNRLDRLRRHDVPVMVAVGMWWAVAADRVRLPWRDLRLRVTAAWSRWIVPTSVPDIEVCPTCRHDQHRACGMFLDDPACGCWCEQAQAHRIELAKIEGWGF